MSGWSLGGCSRIIKADQDAKGRAVRDGDNCKDNNDMDKNKNHDDNNSRNAV
jgi:hypothetical protein